MCYKVGLRLRESRLLSPSGHGVREYTQPRDHFLNPATGAMHKLKVCQSRNLCQSFLSYLCSRSFHLSQGMLLSHKNGPDQSQITPAPKPAPAPPQIKISTTADGNLEVEILAQIEEFLMLDIKVLRDEICI